MRTTSALFERERAVLPLRDELEKRLESTLRLIVRNVERLDDYGKFWPVSSEAGDRFEDKIASETALLVMLVTRVARPDSTLSRLCRELGELLTRRIRTEHNEIVLRRSPQAASTVGLGHVYLQSAGFCDGHWDRLVRRLSGEGYGDMKERQPHRVLERRWARELMDLPAERDDEAIVPFTIVGSRAHPLYMSSADGYAYTHVLMYLSDFGRRSLRSYVDSVRATSVVNACLAWTLLEEDFDLMGEFLLGYVLLGQSWSDHARLAWCTLTEAWDRFGFLPGPTFDERTFLDLERDARRSYAFKETYHSTLVAAIVCAVLLGQNRDALLLPPRPPGVRTSLLRRLESTILRGIRYGKPDLPFDDFAPSGSDEPGDRTGDGGPASLATIVRRCLRFRGASREEAPMWTRALESGGVDEEAASRVLLEGLSIRAVRVYDLAELARCLEDTIALGDPSTLTFQEALEFLMNQQLKSGAIGAQFLGAEGAASPLARDATLGLTACLLHAYQRWTEG